MIIHLRYFPSIFAVFIFFSNVDAQSHIDAYKFEDSWFKTNDQKSRARVIAHRILKTRQVEAKDLVSIIERYHLQSADAKKAIVYIGKLSDQLPSVVYDDIILIINFEDHLAWMLELSFPTIFNADSRDSSFIGGVFNFRGKGMFHGYHWENDRFVSCINTKEDILNYTHDCEVYRGGKLTVTNVDLNHDGLLDLKFSGIIESYCDPKSIADRDMNEKKPRSARSISYAYIFNSKTNTWTKR